MTMPSTVTYSNGAGLPKKVLIPTCNVCSPGTISPTGDSAAIGGCVDCKYALHLFFLSL